MNEFFAYRIFSLIDSFSYELSEAPMNYKTTSNVDDNIFEIGLSSTMNSLAQQSSTQFLKVIKLITFNIQIIKNTQII